MGRSILSHCYGMKLICQSQSQKKKINQKTLYWQHQNYHIYINVLAGLNISAELMPWYLLVSLEKWSTSPQFSILQVFWISNSIYFIYYIFKVNNSNKYMHQNVPELLVFFVWYFLALRCYFLEYYFQFN